MNAFTFPIIWRAPLREPTLLSPVCSGPNVLVAEATKLQAFARADGTPAWSVERAGNILPVVAVDGGCIAASLELEGKRVEMIDHDGRVVWELPGRWNLAPLGLVGANDRFLLSGARRDTPDDSRLWEMSVADALVLRSVPGNSRLGVIATGGGWAWMDVSEAEPRLRVLDDQGARVVATGDFKALASIGDLLLADGSDHLRAYRRDGLAWERPGGRTRVVAADARDIACGHRDDNDLWICCYALDGTLRWKAGPFPSGYPTLAVWDELLIASGIYLGGRGAVAILDRSDGRVLALESGGWNSAHGSVTIGGDAVYVDGGDHIARRERRTWHRIEDAWDPVYLIAVAAQLEHGLGGPPGEAMERLEDELAALRAAGVAARPFLHEVVLPVAVPDLAALRDAVAAVREAGRQTYDRIFDDVAWMFCAGDWPLWGIELPEDLPERRVELLMFDDMVERSLWAQRARIASYPQLRLLSLRTNGLDGPLGIDLAALPRLEYLSLSENLLERVPPELRSCRSLIHLDLRDNRLTSIEPGELPSSLRWLDIGKNRLSQATVARIRAALPECQVESYAQRPTDPA